MRILIIEDDERIVGYMKRGLEAENHEVEVASDGQRGMDMGELLPFDLILLDIFLPQKNGLEVCRYLRSRQVTTPIFMMTARDTVDSKKAGYSAGANEYLSKPFSFETLLNKMDKTFSAK
ncbi:MAG: response regulator [Nitrospira sp.]|nr:response regulator [Candidatus Manganitrophaceae bacterium]HIL34098.1 response regulator [Candidatus Manganitrophaceae bacterium]